MGVKPGHSTQDKNMIEAVSEQNTEE